MKNTRTSRRRENWLLLWQRLPSSPAIAILVFGFKYVRMPGVQWLVAVAVTLIIVRVGAVAVTPVRELLHAWLVLDVTWPQHISVTESPPTARAGETVTLAAKDSGKPIEDATCKWAVDGVAWTREQSCEAKRTR